MSGFVELTSICPGITVSGGLDQKTLIEEPLRAQMELGQFGENLTQCIFAFEGLEDRKDYTQMTRLNMLSNRGFLPTMLLPFFNLLIGSGQNDEKAPDQIKTGVSLMLKLGERLAEWFYKSYGPYLPASATTAANIEELVKTIYENAPSDTIRRSARKAAIRRANNLQLTEDETRVVIDFQLSNAGWKADTQALRYSNGTRPEKGVNKAIAEWQTESGPADYALFSGLDFIGLIEAKKMGKDVISDLYQSERYAQGAKLDGQARFVGGPWGEYRVPFLFSTNARPYLDQLKEKSGIWFLDVRNPTNHPRPLHGWYSAGELTALLHQDIPKSHKRLSKESMDYLGLRDYQQLAVKKIESALKSSRTVYSSPWQPGPEKPVSPLVSLIVSSNQNVSAVYCL